MTMQMFERLRYAISDLRQRRLAAILTGVAVCFAAWSTLVFPYYGHELEEWLRRAFDPDAARRVLVDCPTSSGSHLRFTRTRLRAIARWPEVGAAFPRLETRLNLRLGQGPDLSVTAESTCTEDPALSTHRLAWGRVDPGGVVLDAGLLRRLQGELRPDGPRPAIAELTVSRFANGAAETLVRRLPIVGVVRARSEGAAPRVYLGLEQLEALDEWCAGRRRTLEETSEDRPRALQVWVRGEHEEMFLAEMRRLRARAVREEERATLEPSAMGRLVWLRVPAQSASSWAGRTNLEQTRGVWRRGLRLGHVRLEILALARDDPRWGARPPAFGVLLAATQRGERAWRPHGRLRVRPAFGRAGLGEHDLRTTTETLRYLLYERTVQARPEMTWVDTTDPGAAAILERKHPLWRRETVGREGRRFGFLFPGGVGGCTAKPVVGLDLRVRAVPFVEAGLHSRTTRPIEYVVLAEALAREALVLPGSTKGPPPRVAELEGSSLELNVTGLEPALPEGLALAGADTFARIASGSPHVRIPETSYDLAFRDGLAAAQFEKRLRDRGCPVHRLGAVQERRLLRYRVTDPGQADGRIDANLEACIAAARPSVVALDYETRVEVQVDGVETGLRAVGAASPERVLRLVRGTWANQLGEIVLPATMIHGDPGHVDLSCFRDPPNRRSRRRVTIRCRVVGVCSGDVAFASMRLVRDLRAWQQGRVVYDEAARTFVPPSEVAARAGRVCATVVARTLDDLPALVERLDGEGYVTRSKLDELARLRRASSTMRVLVILLAIGSVLGAVLMSWCTTTMHVQQKTREIGVLRALGLRPGVTLSIFAIQAASIAGAAWVVAAFVAALVEPVLSEGLASALRIPEEELLARPLVDPATWDVAARSVAVSTGLSVLATVCSAWRACRMPVARALRLE